jgi:hypothetical protein
MFSIASLFVLFAFGLVLTGVVFLGIIQAQEDAKSRTKANPADNSVDRKPHMYVDTA